MSNIKLAFILSLVFFIAGILTLPHYGINWDTINHLPRGQAYLNYFLTGKTNFENLPVWSFYYQNPDTLSIDADIPKAQVPNRSLYQSNATIFNWFLEHDGKGHPPLSDILSSMFNVVLFTKLHWVNDVDAYRVYSILLAASLVGLIFYWVSKIYGKVAGLIAALSLALYPLFWSEAHFNNEKDIPETVFWSFMLFSIWNGVAKKSWKWILLSGVFLGLALGTKFNILFSIFIIIPWFLIVELLTHFRNDINIFSYIKHNSKFFLSILVAVLIGITIFVGSWPYLWQDPVKGISDVVGFYKGIGSTKDVDVRFLGPLGLNTYPVQWIVYTTPIIILVFSSVGFFFALKRGLKEKDKVSWLFLLWLIVPIARVTFPGATVYGGIRQIMEYVPALAVLSGVGGMVVYNFTRKSLAKVKFADLIALGLVLMLFIPTITKLIQIHPNENVYFNELIGGLRGAKEKNLPSWGNTFGAAYRPGISWINKNAEKNTNIVLVHELLPNIPSIFVRRDLTLQNSNRSGYLRKGEYAMTLIYQGTENRSYYDSYLEKFISPVYQTTVDGVSILKIWKNDDQHLKLNVNEEIDTKVDVAQTDFGVRFDLGENRTLSRLEIDYDDTNCTPLKSGYVQISKDLTNWEVLIGTLPNYWKVSILGPQPSKGKFIEPFVGQDVRFIDLVLTPSDTCLRNIKQYRIYYFVDLKPIVKLP